MGLPNLFVVGVPKAGTTSLHYYLSQHPSIWMSRVKEPKFYMTEAGQPPRFRGPGDAANVRVIADRGAYQALFPDRLPDGCYSGESTPFYLWDSDALRRIRDDVPHARLIAVLRDPVARAHSNWAHLWWMGRETISSLPEAIAAEDERQAAGWEPFWFYRALGRYGEQLAQVYRLFDPSQVKVVQAERLRSQPVAVIGEIFDFLGLPACDVDTSDELNRSVYLRAGSRGPAVQALLRGARRAARRLPVPMRRAVRRAAVRVLAAPARAGPALSVGTYHQVAGLFADERPFLASLGIDVEKWQVGQLAGGAGSSVTGTGTDLGAVLARPVSGNGSPGDVRLPPGDTGQHE